MQRRHFIGGVGAVSIAGLAGTAYVLAPRMPDVMYVQTELDAVARMLKLAETTSKDIIYDLGCGDGRFVVMAARQFGARGALPNIAPPSSFCELPGIDQSWIIVVPFSASKA